MKIKSVAGINCYVKDLNKTANFYETLGFEVKKREANHVTIYLNWFWIDFLAIDKEDKPEFQKEANLSNKGAGLYLYISVDNVDDFYNDLVAKGFKPKSEPRDWPWGNREFVMRDPDGYKLVFFKRK
jgi:catechol 2,3-dioxygenase-like lactoylglutathione lyase family enzyme